MDEEEDDVGVAQRPRREVPGEHDGAPMVTLGAVFPEVELGPASAHAGQLALGEGPVTAPARRPGPAPALTPAPCDGHYDHRASLRKPLVCSAKRVEGILAVTQVPHPHG